MGDMDLQQLVPAMTWTMGPDLSGDGWSRNVHPEDLGRWLDTCVRAFDARQPFEIEYRLRQGDGEYRWMLDRGVPRYAADGRFLGYAGVCIDIESRKRLELALRSALAHERKLRLAAEQAAGLKKLRSALAGVSVLVIDGDPRSRQRIAAVLGLAGAETKTVARPAEAATPLATVARSA